MEHLIEFIAAYIAKRGQSKLEAFDKDVVKRRARGEDESVIAQERAELVARYQPIAWLTDASRRTGRISLVTHAAKFTHSDSKATSVYTESQNDDGYLNTSSLTTFATDAVGNAAVLDVVKFLQEEVEGDSLLACLQRKEYSPFKAFAENDTQLVQWIEGFNQAFTIPQPIAHKLAKQIYFPVDGGYHLLCPLFATSLAQAMQSKIMITRFGDESKAIRTAHRNREWHAKMDIRFSSLAEIHFGGTKPQNISILNSIRGGRFWLLASQPPQWKIFDKAPQNINSIFVRYGQFDRAVSGIIAELSAYLKKRKDENNVHIRNVRERYINDIIDLLFMQVAIYQQEKWQGWTKDSPSLPLHQQLWLDPWRAKFDDTFRLAREKEDWQKNIANDFARWLNYRLEQAKLAVGIEHNQEWKTQPLFHRHLKNMEDIILEALK